MRHYKLVTGSHVSSRTVSWKRSSAPGTRADRRYQHRVHRGRRCPLGARFGSYAPARPWSLGLAIEFVLDWEPPKESGCPICGNEQGEVEDFTLSCPSCTRGLRYSAELLLADLVEPEIAFAVLSRLETNWLLDQIPKEVGVIA